MNRFNLSRLDMDLLRRDAQKPKDPAHTPEIAWSNYLRKLLNPHVFYRFEQLKPNCFFFVAENKVLPGREAPGEGEAIGRPISLCFYEGAGESPSGVIVKPVEGSASGNSLQIGQYTLAELVRAAGFYPDVLAGESARDVEVKLETHFLDHDLLAFKSERMFGSSPGDEWTYCLSDPAPAETVYQDTVPLADMTKMCLARRLELSGGPPRFNSWGHMSKAGLYAAIGMPADAAAAPAAKGKGKGRGRGHGDPGGAPARGRGRGAKGRGGAKGRAGGKG